jgi:hypothetical protein
MAGWVPAATAVLRGALTVTGVALTAVGAHEGRWVPALGGALTVVLASAELALTRVRCGSGDDSGSRGDHRHSAEGVAGQACFVAGHARLATEFASWHRLRTRERRENELRIRRLTALLDATRRELVQANQAAATARSELADLSAEWNALVHEAMQMGADVFNRRETVPRQPARTAAPTVPGANRPDH